MTDRLASGERLKDLRLKRRITQKELGQKIGVSQQAINLIEHDKRKISIDLYSKLCEVLDPDKTELVHIPMADAGESSVDASHTLAAHFDGDEYTDEELKEIRRFAEYIKGLRQIERNNLDKSGNN